MAPTENREILKLLGELGSKVDRSLEQGTALSHEMGLLRKELGIGEEHGRIPLLETQIKSHETRLSNLETARSESNGRLKLGHVFVGMFSGLGGSTLTIFAHKLGIF